MNTDFFLEVQKNLGITKYTGARQELRDYVGTPNSAFFEKNGILIVYVEPYLNNDYLKKSVDELKIIIPIALQHYSRVGIVFDDINFVLEFLSKMGNDYKTISDTFFNQQRKGDLKRKNGIPVYGDKEFLISYLITQHEDLVIEVQNIENAYGILEIRKIVSGQSPHAVR